MNSHPFPAVGAGATIVCSAAGIVTDGGLLALAICMMLLIVAFYAHEFLRLRHYYKTHADPLWIPSEPVGRSEVDDPLLRGLAKARLTRPALRLRGELAPPPDDMLEPMRTLRVLAAPFALWTHANAGDEHSKLSFWLLDVTGEPRNRL